MIDRTGITQGIVFCRPVLSYPGLRFYSRKLLEDTLRCNISPEVFSQLLNITPYLFIVINIAIVNINALYLIISAASEKVTDFFF